MSNSKLSPDLSETEEALFRLEKFPLFDVENALNITGNDVDVLKNILTSMIDEEVPDDRLVIEKAHAIDDWETIKRLVHRMKGGFVYCGTPKLVHACQHLEGYHTVGDTQTLEDLYQQLISVLDETVQSIREWLMII